MRWRWAAAALVLAVVVVVVFMRLSLGARRHGVEVCLEWRGKPSCGRAWAASVEAARRAAADNACGPITRGMTQRMGCARIAPTSVRELH